MSRRFTRRRSRSRSRPAAAAPRRRSGSFLTFNKVARTVGALTSVAILLDTPVQRAIQHKDQGAAEMAQGFLIGLKEDVSFGKMLQAAGPVLGAEVAIAGKTAVGRAVRGIAG